MHGSHADDGGRTTTPLISAIVPTHNRAHCLPRALDSIYGQQRLGEAFEIEVIVVDDGSSDDTALVVRRYPDVHYIRLPIRRGAAAAKNEGLRASRGGYITFLDDDDEWLPHKLRIQVEALAAHPDVGVVYGQSLQCYGRRERLYPEATRAPSGRVFMAMLMDNFCGIHACLLARRTAFDKAGSYDERLASYEDYDVSLRLAFHVPFLFVPGAVHIYHLSSAGLWLSRASSGLGAADAAAALENALRLLPEGAAHAEAKRAARARIALESVHAFLQMEDRAGAWARALVALREHPRIARYAWARTTLSALACRVAMAAASPISATRHLCAEIKAATRHGGLRGRWWARQLVARIWAHMAAFSHVRSSANPRDAAYAAACAMTQVPCYLAQRTLLRIAIRGLLGGRRGAARSAWRPLG